MVKQVVLELVAVRPVTKTTKLWVNVVASGAHFGSKSLNRRKRT